MVPGSANRVAFEESLKPFFKSMEEIEAAWTKVSEFTQVVLSFVSPGEALANFETYAEIVTELGIQTSSEPSPSQNIVLGTTAFGVRCLFQDRIKCVEDKPRTLLAAKVVLEENLRYMCPGGQEDQKSTSMSDQYASQPEDGRDL